MLKMEDTMKIEIKERFMEAWEKHFPGSELPIAGFYANELKSKIAIFTNQIVQF